MKLSDVMQQTGAIVPETVASAEIGGISSDSRKVRPGDVFVCIRGTRKDGNEFAREAIARGAVAVVSDVQNGGGFITVPDARAAESAMWNNFTGDPTDGMKVIAVTGTNGKTTVSYMLREIFREAGYLTGSVTTVCSMIGDETVDTGGGSSVSDAAAAMTTPDPEVFYPLAARMKNAGVRVLIFEASSHALAQRKLDPVRPDAAVFTNLSEEHLDFHLTMENYFLAKASLADRSKKLIINGDDPYMIRLSGHPGSVVCRTSLPVFNERCDFRALRRKLLGVRGVEYLLYSGKDVFRVSVPIPGDYTIGNSLLASAAALSEGVSRKSVVSALCRFRGVPGRMYRATPEGCPFTVLIDYAHTPAALDSLLRTVRETVRPGARITVLFGCGGDRDRSKRKKMGAVASSLADFTVVTSDNPRSEDPDLIIKEIMGGVDREKPHAVIRDRKAAIEYCISEAIPGEVVILAGKGHEKYEITADGKRPFDEEKIVTESVMRRLK
ncbi:MAG: UDP-N-acetylmuramoyl-L-alanyl-D-glutamate--2,6-diaminopimelate ligase [Clostridia bacterium]|nr:UDP-N-acetylmuramoyl-L-alanyl-D-glutamate--2,6-diaminopimelate ligase [Clostridia bacterium]